MAGDDFLGALSDPKATPKKQSAAPAKAKGAGAGGLFDQLMTTLNDIEDPFTRSIVQGAMEARISDKIGQQFHFPDPAEQELNAARTQKELLQEQVKLGALKVQVAQAAMLDLSPTERASLRIGPDEDVFQTDPAKAIEATNALFEAKRLPFTLTPSDLKFAQDENVDVEATQTGAAQRQTAEQRKELNAQAETARSGETLGKLFTAIGEGEGPIGEAITKTMDESTDKEDLDEDRGSELFHNAITNTVTDLSQSSGQSERFIANAMLSGSVGKRLKDELEGLDTDEAGNLVIGKGDSGVTDMATVYLAATALDLGARAGLSDTETMKALGLDYTGVNLPTLLQGVEKIAKTRGLDVQTQAKALGGGFLEAVARLASKEQVGAAAVSRRK